MSTRPWLICAIGLFACAGRESSTNGSRDTRLDQLERSGQRADQDLDRLDDRIAELRGQLGELEQVWDQVERDLGMAERRVAEAIRLHGETSAKHREAVQAYERATRNWQLVAASLVIAASSDKAMQYLCDGKMSRAQVRKHWKKLSVDLNGKDADHIWPKSRGGADHVWNFQALDARINRSVGNGLGWKLANQPLAVLRGAAVSALVALRCG